MFTCSCFCVNKRIMLASGSCVVPELGLLLQAPATTDVANVNGCCYCVSLSSLTRCTLAAGWELWQGIWDWWRLSLCTQRRALPGSAKQAETHLARHASVLPHQQLPAGLATSGAGIPHKAVHTVTQKTRDPKFALPCQQSTWAHRSLETSEAQFDPDKMAV